MRRPSWSRCSPTAASTEMVKMLRRIAEMTEVVSVRQKKPLGLGHAVLCARDLVGDEPFAVMLADDLIDSETPCIRQLLDIFERPTSR